jgi:hypothetical protein
VDVLEGACVRFMRTPERAILAAAWSPTSETIVSYGREVIQRARELLPAAPADQAGQAGGSSVASQGGDLTPTARTSRS